MKRQILLRKVGNAFTYVAARILIIIKLLWLRFVTQWRTLLKEIIKSFATIPAGVLILIIGTIFVQPWIESPTTPNTPTSTPMPTETPIPIPPMQALTPEPAPTSDPQSTNSPTLTQIILLQEDFENCQDITSKFKEDGDSPWLCVNGVYETNNFDEPVPKFRSQLRTDVGSSFK